MTVLKFTGFVLQNGPTIYKAVVLVKEAAERFPNSESKEKWVIEELVRAVPSLTPERAYDFVKVALYPLRLMGVKI